MCVGGCELGCICTNTNKRKSVLSQCVILWVRKKLDHVLCEKITVRRIRMEAHDAQGSFQIEWHQATGCNMWSTVFPLKMCSCFCYYDYYYCYYLTFVSPGNFFCTWVKIYYRYSERSSVLLVVQFPGVKYDVVIKLIFFFSFYIQSSVWRSHPVYEWSFCLCYIYKSIGTQKENRWTQPDFAFIYPSFF